ncbi:MAG: hypothetical protein JNL70_17915 [Saprospiraceae bacterium]|nr:hypothetical protein [Saprospiraceae bacterium]
MTKNLKQYLLSTFIALALLVAGLWNGFPFLYPDDGTYLHSGFMPEMPLDRPITYGLFIYVTSLGGWSLWLTIFAQALMTGWVIRMVLKSFFTTQNTDYQFIVMVGALILSSSISFLSSQLMPDFATPILLLSQLVLLADTPLSKQERRGLFALFFLTTAMHISHLAYNILLIAVYFALYAIAKQRFPFLKFKTITTLLGLTVLSYGTMSVPMAKSGHAFRIGAMAHKGILDKVLAAKCGEKNWQLCAYRDSMPHSLEDFLWSANSPLHKIGLVESKKELNDIFWTSLTTPDLLKLHFDASLKATAAQLGYFGVGEGNAPFLKGSNAFDALEKECPNATPQYLNSRQAHDQLVVFFNSFTHFQKKCVILLLIGCFILLLYKPFWSKSNQKMRFFLLFIFLGLWLNIWLNATLVYPTNRYGAKMIWLVHLAFFMLLLFFYDKKRTYKERTQP